MSHADLENTLRNLATTGTRLDDPLRDGDGGPQVWRFEHEGKPYRLHFYTRKAGGNPALRELQSFQLLQKAGIRSPRAVSAMVGFRLADQRGDALLLESIEPAINLRRLLINCDLDAQPIPHRAKLREQIIQICQQLAKAGLGHDQLKLDDFLVRDDQLYLVQANGVRRGGLKLDQLMRLARSAAPFATHGDYVRAAGELGTESVVRDKFLLPKRYFRRAISQIFLDNEHFSALRVGEWSGVFTRCSDHAVRWSSASRQTFTRTAWERAWPDLLERIRGGQLHPIKRDDSGDVLRGTIQLDESNLKVIVKIPRRKFLRQTAGEFIRGSRARRTWLNIWHMQVRGVPAEWPMLLMERRRLGYPLESVLVFQEVPGSTLANIDLDALDPHARETLFRRAGRTLRRIDQFGFVHTDAKSTNWIVFDDPIHGPRPILVDLYGIRNYRWAMMGIDRLLRAMRQHPQYTPSDSMHLCLGYAPLAELARDKING